MFWPASKPLQLEGSSFSKKSCMICSLVFIVLINFYTSYNQLSFNDAIEWIL